MRRILFLPRQASQLFFPLQPPIVYLPVTKTFLNVQRFDRPMPDPLALAFLEDYERGSKGAMPLISVSESPQSPPQTAPPTHLRDTQ